jgi:CRP/FNR family cyclic AMP-dependent transcriptional regulator
VSGARAGFLERIGERAAADYRAAARPRRYPKGSLLFAEGDRAHEVLVITAGCVKVVVTAASGREVVLDVLEAGDLLGEISAVDGGDRSATAIALTAVEVLSVAQSTFQDFVANHADVARELLGVLASRLRGADRRQLEFGANDAIGRVCQRLVELAVRYGQDGPGGRTVLSMPLSQQELASWAGLSREAVVKGLRALRSLGWVESDGGKVVIVDQVSVSQRALR